MEGVGSALFGCTVVRGVEVAKKGLSLLILESFISSSKSGSLQPQEFHQMIKIARGTPSFNIVQVASWHALLPVCLVAEPRTMGAHARRR